MPLHDWTDDRGWDSVHQLWINALLYWLQDHLPQGYRAYLGSVPGLSIAEPVRRGRGREAEPMEEPAPDFQVVALMNPEPSPGIHVCFRGRLVAAIELVSPRNKDRPSARDFYRNRYLGYVWSGVRLMLIDVHRRPLGFSFVQAVAAELQCRLPGGLPPHVISWNVGGSVPEGGRFLDGWHRTLTVGEPLPTVPLALTATHSLPVDLESTYAEAARRAYLD